MKFFTQANITLDKIQILCYFYPMNLRSILFTLLVLALPDLSQSQDYKYPNIENSVFQIRNYTKFQGTGFYIGNNYFVTNAHVLLSVYDMELLSNIYSQFSKGNNIKKKDKQEIIDTFKEYKDQYSSNLGYIFYKNQIITFKKIVAVDFKHDLIVLEVDQTHSKLMEELTPLKIGSFSQELTNQKGYAYGFPADKPYPHELFKFKEMTFESIHINDINSFHTYTNVNHLPGGSGSPMLIDGKVVGILRLAFHNEASATSSNALIELLNKEPISLTKNEELIDLFLVFIQKIKTNPTKDWLSLLFFYEILEPLNVTDNYVINERIYELENLLEHNPNLIPLYGFLIGYYSNINNIEKAIDAGKKSSSPHFLYLIGMFQLENGNLDKALIDLKKSAENHFNPALFTMAIYYLVTGDMKLYGKYIKKAADGGHALAQIHLAKNNKTLPENTRDNMVSLDDSHILRHNPSYLSSDYLIGLFKKSLNEKSI